jgi:hypothetical protein
MSDTGVCICVATGDLVVLDLELKHQILVHKVPDLVPNQIWVQIFPFKEALALKNRNYHNDLSFGSIARHIFSLLIGNWEYRIHHILAPTSEMNHFIS